MEKNRQEYLNFRKHTRKFTTTDHISRSYPAISATNGFPSLIKWPRNAMRNPFLFIASVNFYRPKFPTDNIYALYGSKFHFLISDAWLDYLPLCSISYKQITR